MNENNNIKLRIPILVLSLLGMATGFFALPFYIYNYLSDTYVLNPVAFSSIDRILTLIPVILLVIFILVSRQKCKSTLLASVFVVYAAINFWDIFERFIMSGKFYSFHYLYIKEFLCIEFLISDLICISACVLLFISILKGITNKSLFAVFICILIQYQCFSGFFMRFYSWGAFFARLSTILPLLAILLFGLNNTLMPIVEPMTKDSNAKSALKALKDAFAAGIISEEEYRQKRNEIISKL